MNLLHLKYVIEVTKAGSISKAASNLYMNQPHLSKTIKRSGRKYADNYF